MGVRGGGGCLEGRERSGSDGRSPVGHLTGAEDPGHGKEPGLVACG